MDEFINSEIEKTLSSDIDNVLTSRMSYEDMKSAVKPASVELVENQSNKELVDSSSIDKSQEEVDPIRETLSSLLDLYTDKLGYQITYDGVTEAIKTSIASSKSSREIIKAIQGDLAANMSEVLIFKSIIVIGRVIDSQLNGIMNTDFTEKLNGETVSILNQMFGWIEKLEAIKAKYSQFDINQKIRDLSNSKSDVAKRTEAELKLIEMLRSGVDSLAFNKAS